MSCQYRGLAYVVGVNAYKQTNKLVSVPKRFWCFDKEYVTLSPVTFNVSKMYSGKGFQVFWFRNMTEEETTWIFN